jgi:hypothetical protein
MRREQNVRTMLRRIGETLTSSRMICQTQKDRIRTVTRVLGMSTNLIKDDLRNAKRDSVRKVKRGTKRNNTNLVRQDKLSRAKGTESQNSKERG